MQIFGCESEKLDANIGTLCAAAVLIASRRVRSQTSESSSDGESDSKSDECDGWFRGNMQDAGMKTHGKPAWIIEQGIWKYFHEHKAFLLLVKLVRHLFTIKAQIIPLATRGKRIAFEMILNMYGSRSPRDS